MQLLHLGTIQEELSPAALVYYVLAPRIRDHKSSKKAKCRFTLNIRLSTSLCPRKPLWPVLSANVPQATPKIPGIWAVDDNRPTNVMLHLWDKREVSRINPFFTSIFVVWGGEVHSTYPPSQGRNELQKLKSCHLGKQEGGRLRSNTVRSKFWCYKTTLAIAFCHVCMLWLLFSCSNSGHLSLLMCFYGREAHSFNFDKKKSLILKAELSDKCDWGKWGLCRLEWAPSCCSCGKVANVSSTLLAM